MNKITTIIIGLVLIVISFYGGIKYNQNKNISSQQTRMSQFSSIRGQGNRVGMGNNFILGKIISKDAQGITIQLTSTSTISQGSAIVLFSSATTIMKIINGSSADLIVGQEVTINGTKNSDGSISANSIQLRSSK